jgi:hypothetical protein
MANTPSFDGARLELFHSAAFECLASLVRFREVVMGQVRPANETDAESLRRGLFLDHIIPLSNAQAKVANDPSMGIFFRMMTEARLALERPLLMMGRLPASSAHELVLGAPLCFFRTWNRFVHPDVAEQVPPTTGDWQLVIHGPDPEMDTHAFLSESFLFFRDFDPLPLHVELKLEYAHVISLLRTSVEEPTIWFHGRRAYSRDGFSLFTVTEEQHFVLQAFLETGCSLDTRELENKSGVTNASRVVSQLKTGYGRRFADAIRTPGRSKTGYFIRVRPIKNPVKVSS